MALRTASTQAAGASRPRNRWVNDARRHRRSPPPIELFVTVADEPQWPALGHDAAGKGDRGFGQIALGNLVDDAISQRFH